VTIPSRSSWGDINADDLDAEWAFRIFAEKSLVETEKMFQENAFYYQEALLSMPAIAFNYYAPEFATYILSDHAKEDSDGASSYLHMIIELLQNFRSLATDGTAQTLIAAAKTVANKQDFYDADVDIYGKFSDLHNEIVRLLNCT
jgi:hypothetical protein